MRNYCLIASLTVLCTSMILSVDAKPPTPAEVLSAAPDALSEEEQELVGLWSVDVDATWAALQLWAEQHPGKNADRIKSPSARSMLETNAATMAFELRNDRRWQMLGNRAESQTWRLTGDVLSREENVPEAVGFDGFKLVNRTLVRYDGRNLSLPTVYVRSDLGPMLNERDLIGDWRMDADSGRAWAKRMDGMVATAKGQAPGDAAKMLIEAGLELRTAFLPDGRVISERPGGQTYVQGRWRIDGDLVIIAGEGMMKDRPSVLRWTGSQLISHGNSMMPGGIAHNRASDVPTLSVKPDERPAVPAPKGE